MNVTLDYLTSNRKWLIRDFSVWGDSGIFDAAIIATESLGSKNIVFLRELLGGRAQIVEYSDLVDHRGNQLPESIINPAVIVIPKNQTSAFLAGSPGESSFRISKPPGESPDPVVDLLIMEMK
jgi:hypothetical protein